MNRLGQSLIVLLMGGAILSITVSGRYTSYVRPGLGPLLVIAGVLLVAVGLASIAGAVLGARSAAERAAAGQAAHSDDHAGSHAGTAVSADFDADFNAAGGSDETVSGHDHDRSRAAWLILAPVLVLLLVAPPALGVAAVRRNAGSQALDGAAGVAVVDPAVSTDKSGAGVSDQSGSGSGGSEGYAPNDGSGSAVGTKAFAKKRPTRSFPALPSGSNPTIGIKEFVLRALYDSADSVGVHPVTLDGFIAPASDGYTTGYSIARLVVSCCAADASPMQIHVEGTPPAADGSWVSAVVTAQDGTASQANEYVPTVDLTASHPIGQPSDPYDH